ncbi:hypothetical protein SO802_006260 [Lithocarpus litseifolius]|uniref:Replication protein A 70 kDa DNA-binding subunit B/D first OB fold domain-containing protein n=1 Tax=Lithocarpus litseifolius TaxID=425828 RepID=A0AAW2DKD3_9ROSI
MAMCWTPLSKISTDRDNWTIKVKLLRMWDAINTKNNEFISFDIIFFDEEGSMIHAIVWKNQARTFRPQLLEGRVYTVKNFRVKRTKGKFSLSSTNVTKVYLNLEIPETAEIINSDNKFASTNFVRSSKESSNANSSVINTNDATKEENDKSSQIEQIRTDQTSNVEDEETDDDNIPLNILQKTKH